MKAGKLVALVVLLSIAAGCYHAKNASGVFARISAVPGVNVAFNSVIPVTAKTNALISSLNTLTPGIYNITVDFDYDIVRRSDNRAPGLNFVFTGTSAVTGAASTKYRMLNNVSIENTPDAVIGDNMFTHSKLSIPIRIYLSANELNQDGNGKSDEFVKGSFTGVEFKLINYSTSANPDQSTILDFDNIKISAVQTQEYVDKSLLSQAITLEIGADHANPQYVLSNGAYSSESWNDYFNAIHMAIAVEEDDSATMEAVDSAAASITTSKAALIPILTEARELYVDPVNGLDTNTGTEASPYQTIERARDEIRQSPKRGDVTVYLRDGEYNYADRYTVRPAGKNYYTVRTSKLTFDERDSGPVGYEITYKAYPGEKPVISGGREVTGWTLYDSELNIYKTNVGIGTDTRQLYVNNQRAILAKSEGVPANLKYESSYGLTTTDTSMAAWNHIKDMEFVFYQEWNQFRIKVDSITVNNGKAEIRMAQPAWQTATGFTWAGLKSAETLGHIENAYELLDSDGEWYLDRTSGDLYYKPRSGEDISTAKVVIPVVEELLFAEGSKENPFENVRFEGIAFEYAGWLRPNIVRSQIGYLNNKIEDAVDKDRFPEAAVTVNAAKGITIEQSEFSKLGSAALFMHKGTEDIKIIGNKLFDISGGGINIGEFPDVKDPQNINKNIVIKNNYIKNIGVEYQNGIAIQVEESADVYIGHNDIIYVQYSPIAGNSGANNSKSERVVIENNYLHDFNTFAKLYDSGAIYAFGGNPLGSAESPAYTVRGNYVRNQLNGIGALYPDNNSTWWVAYNNVLDLRNSPPWKDGDKPNSFITNSGVNLKFYNNYTTTEKTKDNGSTNSTFQFNVYPDAVWPREALDIIANAGLEEEYRDLLDDDHYNRILNPGFETRQENEVWKAEDAGWNRTSNEHYRGFMAAKVTPTAAGGHISQTVHVQNELHYQVSAWVKRGSAANITASLYARIGEGEHAQLLKLDEATTTTGDWTLLEGEFDYSDDAISAPAQLFVQTDGAAGIPYYLDEFSVVEQNKVSAAVLGGAIASALALHDQAVEGDVAGTYEPGSKEQFLPAIQDGQAVLDANGGEESFYDGLKALYANRTWFENKQVKAIFRKVLGSDISDAEQLYDQSEEGGLLGLYPAGSKAELLDAIDTAKKIYADQTITSETLLSKACDALKAAVSSFKAKLIYLNDSSFAFLVNRAESLLDSSVEGNQPGQYTPGSKGALQAALDSAQQTLLKSKTTIISIDDILVDPKEWRNLNHTEIVQISTDAASISGYGVTYLPQKFTDELICPLRLEELLLARHALSAPVRGARWRAPSASPRTTVPHPHPRCASPDLPQCRLPPVPGARAPQWSDRTVGPWGSTPTARFRKPRYRTAQCEAARQG